MDRNRSEGWTHAKKSGHENEELIKNKIETNINYREDLSTRFDRASTSISNVDIGGIKEKSVNCIIGGSTKSKTDLKIKWEDSSTVNISIKKSMGGQVFLIKTSRFIEGYERHYNMIPDSVKRGLLLFFGEANDIGSILSSIEIENQSIRNYEIRKNRLVWSSLVSHDDEVANQLLDWFKSNIKNITLFCFSQGLAKEQIDWVNFIWYKNLLGENEVDKIFSVLELSDASERRKSTILPGNRSGGTTLQLPFGFVQWHLKSMQFHHNLNRIERTIETE